jgi:TPR repeat protein
VLVELYELAAAGGSENAKRKADELKATRLDFYLEGYKIINSASPVSQDEAFNAFRSFAIATAMGESRAPRYLAICYAHGFGTERDRASAFYWFKEAYDRADPESYLPLARCYTDGFGTNRNYKKATAAIKAAMARGIKGAEAELNAIYRQKMNKLVRRLYSTSMRLIHQKKFCEAVKMLSSFEALCYPKAIYTLGCLYEFGRGVEKSDRSKADNYYELACRGSAFGSFTDPNSTYKLKILKMIR